MDDYDIVGVSKYASKEDIIKAYKKKARELHPDKNGTTEQFQILQDAYNRIRDRESTEQFMSRSDPISKKIETCTYEGLRVYHEETVDDKTVVYLVTFHADNSVSRVLMT